jgi:hypothetical protein
LLAELTRKNVARDAAEPAKLTDVLVFGTTCIDGKEDVVECFRVIEKPEDLPDMFVMEMRARLNSHRLYRKFYFKTTRESFDELKKSLENDNSRMAGELCKNPNIKFEAI